MLIEHKGTLLKFSTQKWHRSPKVWQDDTKNNKDKIGLYKVLIWVVLLEVTKDLLMLLGKTAGQCWRWHENDGNDNGDKSDSCDHWDN